MTDRPIQMAWDGESLRPTSSFWLNRAKEQWGDGEVLMVEAREERSTSSHRHFFASINEAWNNLPDAKREEYPTPEFLRKRALIKAGYCDVRDMVCGSASEARNFAAFIKPHLDPYALLVTKDGVIRIYTPKSQSTKAMDKKTFAESKERVLAVIADWLGVTSDELSKAGEAA